LTSRLLKKDFPCFDKLSMSGKIVTISRYLPFALSPSKGEGFSASY